MDAASSGTGIAAPRASQGLIERYFPGIQNDSWQQPEAACCMDTVPCEADNCAAVGCHEAATLTIAEVEAAHARAQADVQAQQAVESPAAGKHVQPAEEEDPAVLAAQLIAAAVQGALQMAAAAAGTAGDWGRPAVLPIHMADEQDASSSAAAATAGLSPAPAAAQAGVSPGTEQKKLQEVHEPTPPSLEARQCPRLPVKPAPAAAAAPCTGVRQAAEERLLAQPHAQRSPVKRRRTQHTEQPVVSFPVAVAPCAGGGAHAAADDAPRTDGPADDAPCTGGPAGDVDALWAAARETAAARRRAIGKRKQPGCSAHAAQPPAGQQGQQEQQEQEESQLLQEQKQQQHQLQALQLQLRQDLHQAEQVQLEGQEQQEEQVQPEHVQQQEREQEQLPLQQQQEQRNHEQQQQADELSPTIILTARKSVQNGLHTVLTARKSVQAGAAKAGAAAAAAALGAAAPTTGAPPGLAVTAKPVQPKAAGRARKNANRRAATSAPGGATSSAVASAADTAAAPVAGIKAPVPGKSQVAGKSTSRAPAAAAAAAAAAATAAATHPTAANQPAKPLMARKSANRAAGAAAAAAAAAAAGQPPTAPNPAGASELPVKPKAAGVARKNCSRPAAAAKSAPAAAPTAGAGVAATSNAPAPARKKQRMASEAVVMPELPSVRPRREYAYAPGAEPWRRIPHFSCQVNLEPLDGGEAIQRVNDCLRQHQRLEVQATMEENERYRMGGGVNENGTKMSRRPDLVTFSWMKERGLCVNSHLFAGHTPGVPIGKMMYSRAELQSVGAHPRPMHGIAAYGANHCGRGVPSFATSIIVSGGYEDNQDNGQEIIYTGEGGNDLLGNKKQVSNQQLTRGNLALVGSIQLGIPVRVTRKIPEPETKYGHGYIYDGLYDVVKFWETKGKEGLTVFQYKLVRRPNQGPLLSQLVQFGGGSAPKALSAATRKGIVDLDISGGKESIPIPAVDETELLREGPAGSLPPCTPLERVPAEAALRAGAMRGVNDARFEQLRASGYSPTVEYITDYEYMGGVGPPPPASVPAKYAGNPHAYIKELNKGLLPYQLANAKNKCRPQLCRHPIPVVYECGPWAGCKEGAACLQAATQQGISYRLEVFRTQHTGWGVRSWDMITASTYVCEYIGEVFRAEDFEALLHGPTGQAGGASCRAAVSAAASRYAAVAAAVGDRAAAKDRTAGYCYDMELRRCDEPEDAPVRKEWADHLEPGHWRKAELVVDAEHKRNVAAFINHSCSPNCFVQPVLRGSLDRRYCVLAIFAGENIQPFEQLTLDYGASYLKDLKGGCKCGAQNCVSKQAPLTRAARRASQAEDR